MGINLNLYYQLGQLYNLRPCLQRHLLYPHIFFLSIIPFYFFFYNSNNLNNLISNPPFPLTWTYTPPLPPTIPTFHSILPLFLQNLSSLFHSICYSNSISYFGLSFFLTFLVLLIQQLYALVTNQKKYLQGSDLHA